MGICGIGPLQLIIIFLIMFIFWTPKGMIENAQRFRIWLRNYTRSPMWREIMGYSEEIREMPRRLIEEAQLQEALVEVRRTTQQAADELNAQLNEVIEAARIPEVEHLRIDTLDVVAPRMVIGTEENLNESDSTEQQEVATNEITSPETMETAQSESTNKPDTSSIRSANQDDIADKGTEAEL